MPAVSPGTEGFLRQSPSVGEFAGREPGGHAGDDTNRCRRFKDEYAAASAMQLRPYQQTMISQCSAAFKRSRRVLMQAPTGAGKTVLCAHMLQQAASKGMRSWFIVHRQELVDQSLATFAEAGLEPGVVASGYDTPDEWAVAVCSVQTLARRLDRTPEPKLIVFDEAHHVAAGTWSRIADQYPDAYQVGLSATPERLDGAGLAQWFDELICGPDVATLIRGGYLAPYRLFAPNPVDTTEVRIRGGEYAYDQLAEIIDTPTVTGDAVRHYRNLADGKRAIGFAVSVEHSLHMVAAFRAAGYRAEHLDGSTPKIRRRDVVDQFRRGEVQLLWNVDLFGEGFDLPAAEACVMMRPTQSLALYLQQCGRVLRTAPGKSEAIILDHAGNCLRHGLPDDPREWSLQAKKRRGRSQQQECPVRLCPKCFAAMPAARTSCTICGVQLPAKPRQVQERQGKLAEVDRERLMAERKSRRYQQAKAETLDDLIRLGVQRGMKNPYGWARHVHAARMRKQNR